MRLSRDYGQMRQFDHMLNLNLTNQVVSGDEYHVPWHYNAVLQRWDGNPATSGDVREVIKSVKNKQSADGVDREHSAAMKREDVDKILAWAMSDCPEIGSALHFVNAVLTKEPTAQVHMTEEVRHQVTKCLKFLAFTSTAWILWTRYGYDGLLIRL